MQLLILFFSMLLAAQVAAQDVSPNTWVRKAAGPMHPGPGGDVRWVGTPAGLVMFGGDSVGAPGEAGGDLGYRRNTWHYIPSSNEWINVLSDAAPDSPSGRCQPALVYVDNSANPGVYMRAGATSRSTTDPADPNNFGANFGFLWHYNTTTHVWTSLTSSDLPNGSLHNRWLLYSNERNKLLVIGKDASANTSLWEYTFSSNTWAHVALWDSTAVTKGVAPSFQNLGLEENNVSSPTVYDKSAQRAIVAFGNQTWVLNDSARTWMRSNSAQHPIVHAYTGFVYDERNQISIMFGAGTNHDETWTYKAATDTWSKLNPATNPPRRVIFGEGSSTPMTENQFAMSIDPNIGTILMWGNEPAVSGAGRDYPVWAFRYVPEEINIPTGVWTARSLPAAGSGPFPDGGKHGRWAMNLDNGRVYQLGGDYTGLSGAQTGRNEIWSLKLSEGNTWRLESPYVRPDISLPNPDEVVWTWDSTRKVFWMILGYPAACCGHLSPAPNMVIVDAMSWNPLTNVLTAHSTKGRMVEEHGKSGHYDPITDKIYIANYGASGNYIEMFDPSTLTFSYPVGLVTSTDGVYRNNPPGYKAEYSAIDIVGRYLYLLNPRNDQATGGEIGNLGNKSELLRWHIDKKTLEFLMYMPTASGVDHNTMVFDTVNRVLIIPWNRNLNTNPSGPEFLQIYHASTGFLERQEIVTSTGGPLKCNGFWFDPFANALACMGGFRTDASNPGNTPIDVPYWWTYRYAPSLTPRPTVLAGPTELKIQIKQ